MKIRYLAFFCLNPPGCLRWSTIGKSTHSSNPQCSATQVAIELADQRDTFCASSSALRVGKLWSLATLQLASEVGYGEFAALIGLLTLAHGTRHTIPRRRVPMVASYGRDFDRYSHFLHRNLSSVSMCQPAATKQSWQSSRIRKSGAEINKAHVESSLGAYSLHMQKNWQVLMERILTGTGSFSRCWTPPWECHGFLWRKRC